MGSEGLEASARITRPDDWNFKTGRSSQDTMHPDTQPPLVPYNTSAGVASASDDDCVENAVRAMVSSLKQREGGFEKQFLAAQKEAAYLQAERVNILNDLREARAKNEGLIAAKDRAEHRWKVGKGQYKKALEKSTRLRLELRKATNRAGYLQKLLAYEERSGFSTLASELQLE